MSESLTINEIIDFIDSIYTIEQQKEVLNILFRINHVVERSSILNDMLQKGILKVSEEKFIKYRLKKYFEKNLVTKVSLQKEFIFSIIPNYQGLKRGKSASYDDLVSFVETNYPDLFDEILSDFKTYDYGNKFSQYGEMYTLYLNRKLNIKANYKYNHITKNYELKNDSITPVLREHGINIEVENPNELFAIKIDLHAATEDCFKEFKQKSIFIKFLLIIFWPVGLYMLTKNLLRSK